jgi:hypothetical protein
MDEHMPQKRMIVRETDVPYMTTELKQAIRNKRKYAQIYAKSRTPENWENKRKWRNIATKERRKAMKDFWQEKTKEIAIKPRQFFQTFKPFISNKCKDERNIHIKINGRVEKDQRKVAEEFAEYSSTMAKADSAEEKDFHDHSSVKAIRRANENTSFQFRLMTVGEVTTELTNLNITKHLGGICFRLK